MTQIFRGLALAAGLLLAPLASADTLLLERTQARPSSEMPARGQSMGQVHARFGTPQERLDPRGGQNRRWPTINRWVYPAFTVYFEQQRVIDVVANQASADEAGPRPPIR
ncbi:hypothetical protein [Stenotrophomonas mori]|uniref:Phosphodiesterase n=1 Tax=Stenotrophomonas mori TaxID=2871096 RepID=A0ABT0SFJ4_9GAMM|nr:hypothetical protein [Stenotrophomonas mori]MCL7714037.1 hypothetical protein [Stenotrophomonas mori]